MKKSIVLLLACFAITSIAIAQEKVVKNKTVTPQAEIKLQKGSAAIDSQTKTENDIYTSLKPIDGQGAVFNTREELEAKVQDKKEKMLALIRENANDPIKVKTYREELWRFENAVVQTPKSN